MKDDAKRISSLFRIVSAAPRLRILLAIGTGEACVCHLEAFLGWRQAYISQHLMALRKGKVLASRRAGRFVFYRLRDPELLGLIEKAAELTGATLTTEPVPAGCVCPTCSNGGGNAGSSSN